MAQISSALKREIGEIAFILLASHEHVKSVAALVSGPDLVKPRERERGWEPSEKKFQQQLGYLGQKSKTNFDSHNGTNIQK